MQKLRSDMQRFAESIHKVTPLSEKLLAATGAAVGGSLTLAHVNTMVGVTVGVLTALMLVPRVILAWRDMIVKIRHLEEHGEEQIKNVDE